MLLQNSPVNRNEPLKQSIQLKHKNPMTGPPEIVFLLVLTNENLLGQAY